MEIDRPVPINANEHGQENSMSLYDETLELIEKLYSIPGFEFYLFPEGVEQLMQTGTIIIDPIPVLFGCFRLGAPLCLLFNQLRPRKLLHVPDVSNLQSYTNVCKKCVYHFLVAVKEELSVADEALFTVSDLYKDDTNTLVKAMKTVSLVIDHIQQRGFFPPKKPLPFNTARSSLSVAPKDNREKAIAELLETERAYLNSLQKLHTYQQELTAANVNYDVIYRIFSNLPELLDFQRRFLISMEATLSLPHSEQRIGSLFIPNEENFSVYDRICANYNEACGVATDEAETLLKSSPSIDPIRGLPALLIKPVQRICKYPLLLNEIVKLSNRDSYPYYDELLGGLDAMKRVAERVNEILRVEENSIVKQDLIKRTEDWQNMNPDDFGKLLLHDKFFMTTNDGEHEKDYHLFLFEKLLICMKQMKKKKKRNKEEETVYYIRGNIHIFSIVRVQDVSRPEEQHFELCVSWADMGGTDEFNMRCRHHDQIIMWKDRMNRLIKAERKRRKSASEARAAEATERVNALQLSNASISAAMVESDSRTSIGSSSDGIARRAVSLQSTRHINIGRELEALGFSPMDHPSASNIHHSNTEQTSNNANKTGNGTYIPPRTGRSRSVHNPVSSDSSPILRHAPSNKDMSISDLAPISYLSHVPPNGEQSRAPSAASFDSTRRSSDRRNNRSNVSDNPSGSLSKLQTSFFIQPSSGPSPNPLTAATVSSGTVASSRRFSGGPPSIPLPPAPPKSAGLRSGDSGSYSDSAPSRPSTSQMVINGGTLNEILEEPPRSPRSPSRKQVQPPFQNQPVPPSLIKVKTIYQNETFLIAIPISGTSFSDLLSKITRKIRIGNMQLPSDRDLRLKYRDEEGDWISMNSDDDVALAFDLARNTNERPIILISAQ